MPVDHSKQKQSRRYGDLPLLHNAGLLRGAQPHHLASTSATPGAPFSSSMLRQANRLIFWSWPITTIGARPRSSAILLIHA